MEILGKLFGGVSRVKLMKLFLANQGVCFDMNTIVARSRIGLVVVKKEISILEKAELIRKKDFFIEIPIKKNNKKSVKKKVKGWILNDKYPYLLPLQNLLVNMISFTSNDVLRKFTGAGKIKLILVSGFFIQNSDSRVDVLVVGDGIKTDVLEKAVGVLEAEIGKELRYVVFDTEDFKYRLSVYDKLVRDILDYPHQKIVNKLGI